MFEKIALRKVKMLSIQICQHVDYVHQTVIPAYDLVGIILAYIDKTGVVPYIIDSLAVSTWASHPTNQSCAKKNEKFETENIRQG
jgi:hypothetical protein